MKGIYKAILLLLCLIVLVSGCGKEKTGSANAGDSQAAPAHEIGPNYRDSLSLNDENLFSVINDSDRIIDISDVNQLRDAVTNVFIARVDSIDGCSTTVSSGRFCPVPDEYGKLTVLQSLKGEISNSTVNFAKPGGIMSIAEYEKYAPAELIENHDKHRREAGLENIDKSSTYQRFFEEGDIELEVGKTYLFFANHIPETGYYLIDGVQYGAREVIYSEGSEFVNSILESDELQLMNSDTEEAESLRSFVDTYFPS